MSLDLIVFGFIVGIALGLSGGGGSIFAVPLLVYGAKIPVHQALVVSLIVVGTSAFFGAWLRIKAEEVDFQSAFIMFATGLIFAPLGVCCCQYLLGGVIMLGFGCLMIAVGLLMLWKARRNETFSQDYVPIKRNQLFLIAGGVAVGFLNGLFGVGGGFLIVPVLLFAASLPIRRAMATSLLVIGCVSFISVFVHVMGKSMIDYATTGYFLAGGIIGMAVGTVAAKSISATYLQQGFALMVIVVGLFVLFQT